jgi:predicted dehydrogenase
MPFSGTIMLEPDILRIAVIGAGHMANKIHCPLLAARADARLVAICDRNGDKLRASADKFRIGQTYADYRTMIDQAAPDAVFAIGHPHTMYDAWMWCLQRGVDLFIEKPMGLNLHQARALAYAAQQHDCVTQVGFQRRAHPMLRAALEQCRARGQVSFASVEFTKHAPGPFLGARDHMFDDGVHAIDTLRAICGGEVVAVNGVSKRIGTPDINLIVAQLEFDSGAVGQIHCNWTSGRRRFRVGIHAPSICAEVDLDAAGQLFMDGDGRATAIDAGQFAGTADQAGLLGFREKIDDFLACVRSRRQAESHFADALKTHLVAETILAIDLLR